MRTSSPGKAESGFSALDALIAIFIVAVVWGAVFPLVRNLSRSAEVYNRKTAAVYSEIAEREIRSWSYGTEVHVGG